MTINKEIVEKFLKLNNPMTITKGNKDLLGLIDCDLSKEYLYPDEFLYYFVDYLNKNIEK